MKKVYLVYEYDNIKERLFRAFSNKKDAQEVVKLLNKTKKLFKVQSSFRMKEYKQAIVLYSYRPDTFLPCVLYGKEIDELGFTKNYKGMEEVEK